MNNGEIIEEEFNYLIEYVKDASFDAKYLMEIIQKLKDR